ncbi:MAG: type II toxin-antitoxin system RelE/ParE family toxin [Elusimicrobia bacterium]|nr:type II toxin-antitoxin system RelE/ParE family toxin [Elusimicrobiota bacterium]
MDGSPYEVVFFRTPSGRCPVQDWFRSLDSGAASIVSGRLNRLRRGLFGDAKNLGGGLWELRIDAGPGYRVYYGVDGRRLVVLLRAGQKRSQAADIGKARKHWLEHLGGRFQ